ncbi:hypothetical protein CALCODRAFT_498847 [Calocera cornea HHB12733]|uniref:Leo1-domain-containing protein n=1 Tax=Calocera cornea HHB12733 TaxID=1353952 RepID=A0A165EP19_9BASI|nr:hypothetical protein CALCODRAFT_498847 [Calocera cornea HHB12733]
MSISDPLAHHTLRGEFEQVTDPAADDDDDDLFGDAAEEKEAREQGELGGLAVPYPDVDEQAGRALRSPDGDSGDEGGRDLLGLSSPEARRRKALAYAEEEPDAEEPDQRTTTTAEVYAPRLPVLESSDGKYWILKLPNYVQIDAKPFDPRTYAGPEETEREVQEAPTPEAKAQKVQEMSHFIQYQVKNALRWRWVRGEDGQMKRESNARVIQWSDGTRTIQVGTEFWDLPLTPDHGNDRHTSFAVVQMQAPGILQATRALTGRMEMRPTGLTSRTHKDLVRAIGQKHSKIAKLLMTSDGGRAPEARYKDALKEDNRAAAKRRTRERAADGLTPRKRGGRPSRGRREEMWSEEEEEYPDEEEGGEEEDGASGRRGRGGGAKGRERDGRRAGSYEEDDFLVKDDEDEDEDDGVDGDGQEERASPRRAGKKRARAAGDDHAGEDEEMMGKDEMDLAEEALEAAQRQRQRKRAKSGAARRAQEHPEPPAEQGEGEGDVLMGGGDGPESEEEEEEDPDEVGVRRVGAGAPGGRRRVVVEEEEE